MLNRHDGYPLLNSLKPLPIGPSPVKRQRSLFTDIDTGAAEDTFTIFQDPVLDHLFYRQAHRTPFGADMAMCAGFRIGLQDKRRPAEHIPGYPAQYHEGRHPAEMMTKRPPTEKEGRQHNQQKKDQVVDDKALKVPNRQAVRGLIEKIHLPVSTGPHGQKSNCPYPGYPYQPFYEIAFHNPAVSDQKKKKDNIVIPFRIFCLFIFSREPKRSGYLKNFITSITT